MAGNETLDIRVEDFRTAHSEQPAGMIVLEVKESQGSSAKLWMPIGMAYQVMKSLEEQISKTHGKFN